MASGVIDIHHRSSLPLGNQGCTQSPRGAPSSEPDAFRMSCGLGCVWVCESAGALWDRLSSSMSRWRETELFVIYGSGRFFLWSSSHDWSFFPVITFSFEMGSDSGELGALECSHNVAQADLRLMANPVSPSWILGLQVYEVYVTTSGL